MTGSVIDRDAGSPAPLRVLIAHNAYQLRGGEDSVVEAETALLRQQGHEVDLWIRHNNDVSGMSRLNVARQTLWSTETVSTLRDRIARFQPDVIHVHNTLPLISPSVFWAAAGEGVPVVQTLHNFRLLCPQATFLREGRVCEDCLGRLLPWPAVQHRCYRESAVQTAAVATMVTLHKGLGTWRHKVTRYIALNEFCRGKFIAGGLPADRIDVKPNFVDQLAPPDWSGRHGGVYVGRLSVEKGVATLIEAMRAHPTHRVEVIGSGPLEADLKAVAGDAWLGALPLSEVLARLSRAAYLVLPSACYEGFPRTLVEAYACGVPVIASRHGSLQELVHEGRTGLLFEPGNAAALAECIRWAQSNPQAMLEMGKAARAEYEALYTPERNVTQLEGIYRRAMADLRGARLHGRPNVQ